MVTKIIQGWKWIDKMRENIENKVQFEHCNLHLCQGIQVFPESPEVLGDPKTKHEKNISHVKTFDDNNINNNNNYN